MVETVESRRVGIGYPRPGQDTLHAGFALRVQSQARHTRFVALLEALLVGVLPHIPLDDAAAGGGNGRWCRGRRDRGCGRPGRCDRGCGRPGRCGCMRGRPGRRGCGGGRPGGRRRGRLGRPAAAHGHGIGMTGVDLAQRLWLCRIGDIQQLQAGLSVGHQRQRAGNGHVAGDAGRVVGADLALNGAGGHITGHGETEKPRVIGPQVRVPGFVEVLPLIDDAGAAGRVEAIFDQVEVLRRDLVVIAAGGGGAGETDAGSQGVHLSHPLRPHPPVDILVSGRVHAPHIQTIGAFQSGGNLRRPGGKIGSRPSHEYRILPMGLLGSVGDGGNEGGLHAIYPQPCDRYLRHHRRWGEEPGRKWRHLPEQCPLRYCGRRFL